MKHTFTLFVGLSMMLLAVLTSQNTSVFAASFGGIISIDPIDGGTCANSSVNFTYELTGVTDDTGGNIDLVYEIYRDGDGDLIDIDPANVHVAATETEIGSGDSNNPIDASPVTMYIYDTTSYSPFGSDLTQENVDWILANGPLLATASYDVRNIPSCAGVPYFGLAVPQLPAPQIGMISISASQTQPVYEAAGGGVVRDADGNELWLPQDYDGNGYDTHLVMSSTEIDGQTWYEVWIGAASSTVWVPADKVTIVE